MASIYFKVKQGRNIFCLSLGIQRFVESLLFLVYYLHSLKLLIEDIFMQKAFSYIFQT